MRLPEPKKRAHKKRLKEWEQWLTNFQQQNVNTSNKPIYKLIPNASWLLNHLYWRIAEQYLRPILATNPENEEEHRIHPYKIVAACEITVMMTLPLQTSGGEKEIKKVNALLAWFIATQIIEGWKTGANSEISAKEIDTIALYKEQIDSKNLYPESFAAEHVKWLMYLNVTIEKPLLLLAQCWRLFYIACLCLKEKS